ncbi:SET domain-containing protein-lysine N-methyltransferase [Candidatus Pacearchaeota archaeon]|nr:SET domain-containing protein-lysine N-methyltransferase [Candidatus Pacearchaeota archaeon]
MKEQKANEFVKIRYSKIHGNGGFAKKDIKKGTKLIEYIGKKITKEEAERVSDKDGVFLFELSKKWDIDGNVPENTARFINHSCDPNCDFEIKNKQIWIRAMKDIKKGEELSYNYGFDLDGYKRYPCRCGAKACVGFILDKDHWSKVKKKKTRVLVAMSGGVDSSVAALMMKNKGYEVIGAFMKNWSDTKNDLGECTWRGERRIAQRIASMLNIPLKTLDFEKEYRKLVVEDMYKKYKKGITPNPDIDCNEKVKFPLLIKAAKKLECDFLVTGHYARIKKIAVGKNISNKILMINNKTANKNIDRLTSNKKYVSEANQIGEGDWGVVSEMEYRYSLLRAKDELKDQSYFLYRLKQGELAKTIFPIGDFTKNEIREIARKNKFPNFDKKSTVGICFIGKVNLKKFLQKKIKAKKGKILDPEGKVIGQHDGIYYYTIGQRIGSRFGIEIEKKSKESMKKWYVARKNAKTNTIIAAPEGHELNFRKEVYVNDVHWINKNSINNVIRNNKISKDSALISNSRYASKASLFKGGRVVSRDNPKASGATSWGGDKSPKVFSRIRQVGELLPSKILINKSKIQVTLNKPITGVSEGQAIVIYNGKECLGGGVISFN